MSLGQTMLMVMFLALTMIMIVNALGNLNNADIQVLTAEAYKTAVDLGESLMAEIVSKKYDEVSNPALVQGSPSYPGGFTAPPFGPGSTEVFTLPDVSPYQSIQKYDDVDDYNGYSRITESTNGLGSFRDSVIVYYVSMLSNPPIKSTTQQWTKRIEVWVTQDNFLKKNNTNIWVKLFTIVTPFKKG